MPITTRQRELRRNHLGSSDMAAILGVSPYSNAYNIWLDKTGQLEEQPANDAMVAGNRFESGVLEFAEGQLGKLRKGGVRTNKTYYLKSHMDAVVIEPQEPVEAKTGGLFGPLVGNWGEPETDEVPEWVIVQCHVHMMCMNDTDVCHVPTFLGGRGFNMYHVYRDHDICDAIADHAVDFWENHVVNRVPPPNEIPSLSVIKRIRHTPDKITEVDPALVEEWQRSKLARLDAQKLEDIAKAQLLAAIGDAEAATYGDSKKWLTKYEQVKKAHEVKESKYRVLRTTNKPKG